MEETKKVGNFLNNVEKENEFTLMAKEEYFVDKSLFIAELNKNVGRKERYICITRPRRFGKSINAAMIASYYTKNLDMSDVFSKLKVKDCPSYKEHLNKHNVIYMSFNTGNYDFKSYEEYKAYFVNGLIKNMQGICPDVNTNALISDVLDEAYRKIG